MIFDIRPGGGSIRQVEGTGRLGAGTRAPVEKGAVERDTMLCASGHRTDCGYRIPSWAIWEEACSTCECWSCGAVMNANENTARPSSAWPSLS